jgi:hypothetical protein
MATIKSIKGRPDTFATFEEKKTDDYGLKVGNLIANDWFGKGLINSSKDSRFLNRRDYVRNNRLFVRGEHDLTESKNYIARGDRDLDLLNISWKSINFQSKFCNIVSNAISDENYVLDIRSSDKLSLKLKEDKKEAIRRDMVSMPLLRKTKEALGIDLLPKGMVPESEEELDFLFETDERPKTEIFEEVIIDYVKNSNDWDFIEQQNNKDVVQVGLIAARVYTDKNDGIKVAYVDPENYIHSNVTRTDFADKYYEGVVDTITISDLRRESDFTETELRTIAQKYGIVNSGYKVSTNFSHCPFEELLDFKVDVLRFAYKTSKRLVFKKKLREGKTVKVSLKNELFKVPEQAEDVAVAGKTLDTWLEGNYIIGADAIYGYKECENLARDTMNKAMSPFVVMSPDIYENIPRSFLDDIKPMAEDLMNIIYKIRALRAELKPDLVSIDLDQLANLGNGKGGVKKNVWEDALSVMNVKGVVFTKRNDLGELGIKDGPAVNPTSQQQGSAIGVLLNEFAFQYNLIRDVTGVNPAVDGSLGEDALVGVSQMAKLAGNNATKHIVNTTVQFNKKICELISTRVNGIFGSKEAKHIQEMYAGVVGKSFSDAIEVLKSRHLHEFAFTFRFIPSGEEMREFNEGLSVAASKGYLDEVVVITAKSYARTNVKQALKYLAYHTAKEKKRIEESQMKMAESKSQNDAMAAKAKVEADTQAYQSKAGIDIQKAQALSQLKLQEAQALKEIEEPYNDRKFQQDLAIAQAAAGVKRDLELEKEDRKDSRSKQEATQQSKIMDAKEKGEGPVNFEEDELDLSMFGL